MLLSMYLLYRFARSGESWTYVFDVGLFVVLISLLSALVPVSEFFFFSFPVSFLSFPFYFWTGDLAAPAALRGSFPWLPYHSIRFLTFDLNLTPDYAVIGGGITTDSQFYGSGVAFAFWVLFLVNVLGGVVGYVVGRRFSFPAWSEGRCLIVGIVSVVVSFVGAVVLGEFFSSFYSPVVGVVFFVVFGFGAILVDLVVLWFLLGLAERGRVASLMVLGGLVLILAGGWFGQVVAVMAGWAFLALGLVVYLANGVVGYVRVRDAEVREEAGLEPEAEGEGKVETEE
jgi:hypothetical protein